MNFPLQSLRPLAVLILITMLLGCKSESTQENLVKPIPVEIVKVLTREKSLPIHGSGILSSPSNMKLSFKVGGIIENIAVDEGATVRKGQILARLNLAEINARVLQAQSGYQKAQRDYKRAKKLYAESAATQEQMQDAATALDIAKSNLDIAQFNLKHATIRAPLNGKILRRFAEENELIGPGHPVFLFAAHDNEWIVRCGVSDRQVLKINSGDSTSVTFDTYPGEHFPGYVSEIAQAADPMSGTFEIKATLQQQGKRLVAGMVAAIDVFPARKNTYRIIPIEALNEANGESGFVYTITSTRHAKKIPVQIKTVFKGQVAVTSGLETVDSVVTTGSAYLRDGALVEIKN
ncbi:MAG: efflux RND transporter periplasmic adaptor subunit [Calditrichaeota bacterium]|nr:efflux RND transporter periplasmic adaptor subunit [Calditrichota bacterium]